MLEILRKNKVRKIKPEWVSFSVSIISVILFGIVLWAWSAYLSNNIQYRTVILVSILFLAIYFISIRESKKITEYRLLIATLSLLSGIVITILLHDIFIDQWIKLIITLLPVLIFIILPLVEDAKIVKAKFGNFVELELERKLHKSQRELRIPFSMLKEIFSPSVDLFTLPTNLDLFLRFARSKSESRILIIEMDMAGDQDSGLGIHTFKSLIYSILDYVSIEYLVFVDKDNKVISHISIEQFRKQYPATVFDLSLSGKQNADYEVLFSASRNIYNDYTDDENIKLRDLTRYFLNYGQSPEYREAILRLKISADGFSSNRYKTFRDFVETKFNNETIRLSDIENIYSVMKREDFTGIPLVDNDGHFIEFIDLESLGRVFVTEYLSN